MNTDARSSTKCQESEFKNTTIKITFDNHAGFIPVIQSKFNICKPINHIKKMKDIKHMVISKKAKKKKHLTKFNGLAQLKTLNNLGMGGNVFNILQAISEKPIANLIMNGEKSKALAPGSDTIQMSPLLLPVFNIKLEVL